ncbi:MAG: hypothetical protein R3266_14950 [Gemmatimonadota bacterium]|nr:hypothetical protein [Gemmatimonadota bacterium]
MAERTRSEDDSGRGSARKGRSRRLGRGIATSVVVAGLAYLILSGLFSVIPQIFRPERADLDPTLTCEAGIRDLRSELLARAGERVAAGGSARADLSPWLRHWDRRHVALEERCEGDLAQSWNLLGRLRERLESDLARYEAGEGDLDRALTQSLPTSASTTPRTKNSGRNP